MGKKLLGLLILVLVAGLKGTTFSAAQNQDDAEIRDVETQQQQAWNHHDAKAYANLFTQDGDIVNVTGWWWKGRPEIEKNLVDAYAFVFRDSILTINEVHVNFLAPQIAVAHVRWSMVGAKSREGIAAPQQGIQIQILQKTAGRWLIVSFQNTNSIPEVPFPKEPLAGR